MKLILPSQQVTQMARRALTQLTMRACAAWKAVRPARQIAARDDTPRGARAAERTADFIGSWPFLIGQATVLAAWVVLNGLHVVGWDPEPFILLNLMLSFQAAFTGPVLLIAANVGAARDRRQTARISELVELAEQQNEQIIALAARLDEHVNGTAKEHGEMLADMRRLMSEMHAVITVTSAPVPSVAH